MAKETPSSEDMLISSTFSVTGIPYPICAVSDVPHILKNIRNGLVNNKVYYIDDEYVKSHNLKTNEVRLETIQKLIDLQENMELKIAPHLNSNSLSLSENYGS